MPIMKTIKKLWQWVVYSSVNSDKISLSVKGILGTIVTVATIVLGLANIHVGSALTSQLIDSVITLIQAWAGLISALVAVGGIVRKIFITVKGQHPAFPSVANTPVPPAPQA